MDAIEDLAQIKRTCTKRIAFAASHEALARSCHRAGIRLINADIEDLRVVVLRGGPAAAAN